MSANNARIIALRQQHDADEWGVWEILGEDPNCDLGGHHSNPRLAIVQGRYGEVLERAVELPRFWTWGYGGTLRRLETLQVEDLDRMAALEEERKALEERIREVKDAQRQGGSW